MHCLQQRSSVLWNSKGTGQDLETLVGKSPYNVHNTRDFWQQMKNIKLQQHECIMSYDVKASFTLVPIEPAIDIIKKHLEENKELQQRTSMTVNNIISLLKFCLKNTYFLF